eukprot:2835229-Pyramimonas_sp.AAC.1
MYIATLADLSTKTYFENLFPVAGYPTTDLEFAFTHPLGLTQGQVTHPFSPSNRVTTLPDFLLRKLRCNTGNTLADPKS